MMPSVSYGYAGGGRESDDPNYDDLGQETFDDYIDGTVATRSEQFRGHQP